VFHQAVLAAVLEIEEIDIIIVVKILILDIKMIHEVLLIVFIVIGYLFFLVLFNKNQVLIDCFQDD